MQVCVNTHVRQRSARHFFGICCPNDGSTCFVVNLALVVVEFTRDQYITFLRATVGKSQFLIIYAGNMQEFQHIMGGKNGPLLPVVKNLSIGFNSYSMVPGLC